jgi:hypothetical protein
MTFDIFGNISGFGGDSQGAYNIVGKLGENFGIEFYKNYSNGNKIQFQGNFQNNGKISGHWTNKDGDYGPLEVTLNNSETWIGTIYNGRKKVDIGFN